MQDDIVASLASQLGAELINDEARRAERTPTPDSMDLYFQGMFWINKGRNPADTERGRDFFKRALALDPDNLDAAVGSACADVQAAVGYYVDNRAERLESVKAKLNRVLSRSPNNAQARYCLGRALVQNKGGVEGVAEAERALVLNPNLASAHALIGLAKLINGHPEEPETMSVRRCASVPTIQKPVSGSPMSLSGRATGSATSTSSYWSERADMSQRPQWEHSYRR
jgi:hypothetical protein